MSKQSDILFDEHRYRTFPDLTLFDHIVVAICKDEISLFIFDHAFYEIHDDFYVVFPEHHMVQIFHMEEYIVRGFDRHEEVCDFVLNEIAKGFFANHGVGG